MGQILLVRHGQASFGAADYDALSPLGFEQSRLLGVSLAARAITVEAVVHGTMRRHRETAETCAEGAGWYVDSHLDPGWDEFDFLSVLAVHPQPSLGEEPTKAEFQHWFEVATAAWIAGDDRPYAETFTAFTTRVSEALGRTVALAENGGVAVFSSGGPVAWAVAELLAGADAGAEAFRSQLWTRLNRMMVNSALTRLISGSRGVNLLSYNEQSHLDGVAGALSYR